MAQTEPIRVAVVGAGIAGLTAALRLAERGFEVQVFEERVYLGGKLGAYRHTINSEPLLPFASAQPDRGRGLDSKYRKRVNGWIDDYLEAQSSLLDPQRITTPPRAEKFSESPVKNPAHGAESEFTLQGELEALCGPSFKVSLFRRGDQRQRLEASDDAYHEHCYHMYLNWYRNFWQLMSDIGREKTQYFEPIDRVTHLFPGGGPPSNRTHVLRGLSSMKNTSENLLAGAAPIPDMFLWFYSATDLVSHPLNPARYLDRTSVHGFMQSRWYATEESAAFHEHLLSKAFAVPTYYSSAYAYRRYLEYSVAHPEPMLWVLKDDCYNGLFAVLERKLCGKGCRIWTGISVTDLMYKASSGTPAQDDGPHVTGLKFRWSGAKGWQKFTDAESGHFRTSPEQELYFKPDYVILAVPPVALAEIVNGSGDPEPIRALLPSLAAVRKLQSGVIASLDLYFNRKLPDIPYGHMVLRDSKYGLTLIDNAQIWIPREAVLSKTREGSLEITNRSHRLSEDEVNVLNLVDGKATLRDLVDKSRIAEVELRKILATLADCGFVNVPTRLNVVATDFYKIEGMTQHEATSLIIKDLLQFIDFDEEDIDYSRTFFHFNDRDPLFLNEVGTEPWRPGTCTEIPNLFIAGDFCDNEIGVVSVECAVVSGLRAARAVQAQAAADRSLAADAQELEPIPILLPETYPLQNADALKLLLTPYAAASKVWSRLVQAASKPDSMLSPQQLAEEAEHVLATPAAMAADWARFVANSAQWLAGLPYSDED
jgi:hypothetical protein